jgi:hypothetical protein
MGITGKGSKSIRKYPSVDSKIPQQGYKKLVLAHETEADETYIATDALNTPSIMATMGFVNPSAIELSTVRLTQHIKNTTVVSSLRGTLIPYTSYTITQNDRVDLSFDAEEGEIFVITIDSLPINQVKLGSELPQWNASHIQSRLVDDSAPEDGQMLIWDEAESMIKWGALDMYPVGSQYIQYPTVSSDDPEVSCPEEESPAVLYGGEWDPLWEADSLIGGAFFFRTPGGDSGNVDETSRESNGRQRDRMQRITGIINNSEEGYTSRLSTNTVTRSGALSGSGRMSSNSYSSSSSGSNNILTSIDFDSDNSPNSRTGSHTTAETRVKNRHFRIWIRTA